MLQALAALALDSAASGPKEQGMHAIAQLWNNASPINSPDVETLIDLWQNGWVDDEKMEYMARREGWLFKNIDDTWQNFYVYDKDGFLDLDEDLLQSDASITKNLIRDRTWKPDTERLKSWINRGWITADLGDAWLRMSGIVSPAVRDLIITERFELPTPQDLIQFSVRHGFEPDILKTFGYAKEIPTNYLKWAGNIGLSGSSEVQIDDATDENGNPIPPHKASWAEQHWFAHWILPSLGDAYEMLHRLYPTSDFGPSPDWKQGIDFTPELLSLFQRAQDIPKYWRERLQAISFLPLSRIDVRRMFNLDIIDENGVYHSYRAQGYNDTRAKDLLKYAKAAKQDQINQRIGVPKEKALCELYTIGILTEDEVKDFAKLLHVPDANIQDLIHNCNLDATKKKIKTVESAMHKGFLKGVINDDEVKTTLQDMNIREDAVSDLLTQWEIEQQFEFKETSAKDAQSWFESGVITEEEFVGRLQNLRIEDGAILNMVNFSRAKIEQKQLAEFEKQLKELQAKLKQGQAELKAKQKEDAKTETDRIKLLLASSTQANLKAWWSKGLIDEDEVSGRLTLLDYSDDDIQRWLAAFGPKVK